MVGHLQLEYYQDKVIKLGYLENKPFLLQQIMLLILYQHLLWHLFSYHRDRDILNITL